MNKRFAICLSFLSLLGFASKTAAQCNPTLCQTPIASFNAPEACVLPSEHSLDCFVSETTDNTPISLPPFWCTSIENNQWFAFMASAPFVEFNISVDQCNAGGALQAALLETFDCINFNFVSDCFGNIPSGTTQVIANNVPLVPGNVYFLMIDGSAGAKCSFAINRPTITSGQTQLCLPLAGTIQYAATSPAFWSIDPPSAGTILSPNPNQSVEIQWNQPGDAVICATSPATCGSTGFCWNVHLGENVVMDETAYLCPGGSVVCAGNTYSLPGDYTVYLQSSDGFCDSVVNCHVISVQPITNNLGQITLPCSGSYEVCGQNFTSLGAHQITCTGWQGCDSTVVFELVEGDVLADAGPTVFFACNGPNLVTLDGSASSQGNNFSYNWTTPNGQIVSGENGLMPLVDMVGTYCLTVTNQTSGCQMTDCVEVNNPVDLSIEGPAIFCPGYGDLEYTVHIASNLPGTLFFQVNGGSAQSETVAAGTNGFLFNVQLNGTSLLSAWMVDNDGCHSDTVTLQVNEDNTHIEFSLTQTICNSANLSSTLVGNFQNTASTYHWSTGSTTQDITIHQDDWYFLTITDNYGCQVVDSIYATIDFAGNCSYLQGTVRNDLQLTCQLSPDDTPVEGFIVEAVNTSTNESYFGTTDMDGYFIPVPPGAYIITILLPPGNGYVACGNAFLSPNILLGGSFTQNFLIFQQPDCPYMTVDVGINLLRRCMNNSYTISYCNNGSAVANGASIVVTLDPALSLISSTITNLSLGNNQYSFSLGNVQPGECGSFLLLTFLDCGVPLGQVYCVQANIYPNTLCPGYGPNDFLDEDCRPNIGSYDPNVKTASPAGIGSQHLIQAGTELTYQIRFQNTGTDTAYNVVVRDTLADKFDFASLELGASSQPCSFEFSGQRILKLILNDIKLPPISVNEPASIGFVQFKIKLKDDLPPGDLIENKASVYFDNNLPVTTNTYFHTIGTPDAESFQTVDICQGETYVFNGEILSQTGDYTATLVSSLGGDSIVHLSLTVHPKAITELSAQICEGESVVFNGDTLTQTGDFKVTLQTSFGCDSIVNLSLDVFPQYEVLETATICTGSTYFFNGQTLDQSGEYVAHLNTINGCDSTVILMLNIVDIIEVEINANICNSDSYTFDNEMLTQSGAYSATYISIGGCDSIVTLNLTVLLPYTGTETISLCEGETILVNGQQISGGDTLIYTITGGSTTGCDSIVTLIAVELPTLNHLIDAIICEGENYLFDGQLLTIAGVYSATYTSSIGCDSVVTLNLMVNPNSPITNNSLEVVQGYVHHGILITADTVLEEHFENILGCDSTVITTFTVLPNGTDDTQAMFDFQVFPNPTDGLFNIRFHLPESLNIELEVWDLVGRKMYLEKPSKATFNPGENLLQFDARQWPSGVYFVQFKTEIGTTTTKLVVN